MVCKHHPNTPLEWQEVKSQTTHPFTGESIITYQDGHKDVYGHKPDEDKEEEEKE